MELPNIVGDDERLYRVVKKSTPICITDDRRATPALFKDPAGVSVDRDGKRDEEEVKHFIKSGIFKKRAKAISRVESEYCFFIGARVEPAPNNENPFHANIFLDDDEKKRNLQALKLADHCVIVDYDEDMSWTGGSM